MDTRPFFLTVLACVFSLSYAVFTNSNSRCSLSRALKKEIHSYQPVVNRIVGALHGGDYAGKFYADLADYVDTFGSRQAGTKNLEDAIDDVLKRQQAAGLVTSTHDVNIPVWVRGEESAEIVKPRRQVLSILGLGGASATPAEGITAEVIIVKNFDELQQRKDEIPGKIVLYNVPFTAYNETGVYRTTGPAKASKLGAAAVLVRSITPFSINSPHTGQTQFADESLRLPAAAITLEAANLIQRFVDRGQNVTVNLKMEATNYPESPSRNAIADIPGSSNPEEYVVISGHIDSWDVGQGAMDDGVGAFLAWHSLALIKKLGLKTPRRTLRAIMWTSEETFLNGATAYRKDRECEVKNWTIVIESDNGVFKSRGISFDGSDEAACIMKEIASLLDAVHGTTINKVSGTGLGLGSDIGVFADLDIPMAEPYNVPNNYFWFHHTNGDYMDVLKSEDLDQNLAIQASTIYILADLSVSLPKQHRNNTNNGILDQLGLHPSDDKN